VADGVAHERRTTCALQILIAAGRALRGPPNPDRARLPSATAVQASILSLLVVDGVHVVYYARPAVNDGARADHHLIILLAPSPWLAAVLTLPGIAGVILTIGMGVDRTF